MSEFVALQPGESLGNDLPPIDLPKVEGPRVAPRPERIEIRPRSMAPAKTEAADPWGSFSAPPAAATEPEGNPWGAFEKSPVREQPAPKRSVPTIEAAGTGVKNALSFGTAPALAGLSEAGKPDQPEYVENPSPELSTIATKFGQDPAKIKTPEGSHVIAGAAKLLLDWFSGHDDPEVKAAYERGRAHALENEKLAAEQHPAAYMGGQLAGALMGPAFGAMGGASGVARIARGIGGGSISGGLYGGGEAISEGKAPVEVAKSTGSGAATGAVFGAGGSAAMEGGKAVASRVGSIVRGVRDVDAEAGRRVAGAITSDMTRKGPPLTPEEISAANAAGTPRAIVDLGDERTRSLLRASTNISPEAHSAANDMVGPRFQQQSGRISQFIKNLTGGGHAADDMEALERAARAANKPAYLHAYRAGDRSIWSPELERLTGSPDVVKAIGAALDRGKNHAINDGFGAFNPGIKVTPDGQLIVNKGKTGVPTYPNIQFWDYAQRELKDAATRAERAGSYDEAGVLKGIHRQLRDELDKIVPEFGAARTTAATFFGAENALEAGQKFVMGTADIHGARRALQKMTKPERELFARGFASDLADKVAKISDKRNVLDSMFFNNGPARQKIEMALGPDRARQLEALLRAETVVDEARKALGNSTTARQLKAMGAAAGHGVAGAGAVGALEAVHEQDFNPSHIIGAALTFGALKRGAHVVDEKVARRIGEMLVSNDPAVLTKGIQIVSKRPELFNALRLATSAGGRVAAHDIGPAKTAAGIGAALQQLIREAEPSHHGDSLAEQAAQ